MIPWMGRYLLGTTDIRFDDDPDDARCDADEMAYILGEVNTLVPGANLTPDDVLYTYSGVRPLPYAPDKKESDVPRTHVLHEHGGDLAGLITVVGGKLTTYRQLAEDAVDDAFKRLGRKAPRCVTRSLPFPGALADPRRSAPTWSRRACRSAPRTGCSSSTAVGPPTWSRSTIRSCWAEFDPGTGAIGAELVFAVRHDFARTLADVLARRLLLAFEPGHGLESVERAAEILAESRVGTRSVGRKRSPSTSGGSAIWRCS